MSHKKKMRKSEPKGTTQILLSDTAAGEAWLSTLGEPEFRDTILEHLFARMKKAGLIEAFENIHGRNDKGIDYLLAERTLLQRRIIGLQIKSKRITRTGDGTALSSLDVKRECEAAMTHEFPFQQDRTRLDNVALWTSAHITEDAEREFLATGGIVKVQVVKAVEVFGLIERFCSEMVAKIPQCALSQYLAVKSDPKPKAFRLLGVNLHPKTHFLSPQLSKEDPSSSSRLTTHNRKIAPKREKVDLGSFLTNEAHVVIKGGDLSGKTYLLEHFQCIAAEQLTLPFLLTAAHFSETFRSIFWPAPGC